MDIEKERETFEAWFSNELRYPRAIERNRDGYALASADAAWTVWQAARAERAEAAQRVPLTEDQIGAIYLAWDAVAGSSFADFARAIEAAHGIGAPTATEPKGEQP